MPKGYVGPVTLRLIAEEMRRRLDPEVTITANRNTLRISAPHPLSHVDRDVIASGCRIGQFSGSPSYPDTNTCELET